MLFVFETLFSDCAGAECCGRGGRMLEQSAPVKASSMYMRAVQLYTDDAKGSMAQEIVQRAVALHIKSCQWDAACDVLLKWAVICSSCESLLALCRAYLSTLRTLLSLNVCMPSARSHPVLPF